MPVIDIDGQLVDFPDDMPPDELQRAVAQAAAQMGGGQSRLSSLAEQASGVVQGVPLRPMTSPAGMVQRLAKDTFEGFRPPMNLNEAKRMINPNLGQYGPNRFSEDVVGAAQQNANTQAENFVQRPGVNQFPNAAAAVGAVGSLGLPLISPKGMQQAGGIGKLASLGKAGEMALRRMGGNVGKAAISTISPASLDAVKARFDNPKAVKTAMNEEQWGNSVVSAQNEMSKQIRKLDESAKGLLSGEQNIPKKSLVELLKVLKQKYVGSSNKAVSAEAKGHLSELENAIQGIGGLNPAPDIPGSKKLVVGPGNILVEKVTPPVTGVTSEFISERQLKDVMDQYKNITWNDPAGGAKKDVRKAMDAVLKTLNPDYKKAMVPVAQRTKLQAITNKKFALKYDPTTGTYATDATAGKLRPTLLNGKKPESSVILRQLKKFTGIDLPEQARLSLIKKQFTGGATQGSRRVNLGAMVGGAVGTGVGAATGSPYLGGVVGTGAGAVGGAVMDKYGGQLTGTLIDILTKIPTIPSMPAKAEKALILALGQALARRKGKSNGK